MSQGPPGRSRGRSRGRARGQDAGGARRPGEAEGQPPQPAAAAPAPVPQPAGTVPAAISGRAAHRGGARERPGAGDVPTEMLQQLQLAGAGGVGPVPQQRGRRDRFHDPNTRPAHIQDKKGSAGKKINLVTNYYPVCNLPTWRLYQYVVSFNPEIDSIGLRKGLVGEHRGKELSKEYLFDGNMLFSHVHMSDEVKLQSLRKRDSVMINIVVKFVKELSPNDPSCLQLFNILIRRSIGTLGLVQLQRYNYDQQATAKVTQHKMEVWPGYMTSIRFHDEGVLMCTELTFKVLRTDTVLDTMYDWYSKTGEGRFHQEATKNLVGSIVMTRYNNKTYRIDDISWNMRVTDTFMKGDTAISYVDYFAQQYNIQITDLQQPLLLHRPKKREQRIPGKGAVGAGPEEDRIIYLPPELCTLTGIPDDMRADYRVMNDLAKHTRLPPMQRSAKCDQLMARMRDNKEVQDLWSAWGISLATAPVKMPARCLPAEKIQQANKSYAYASDDADWTRDMRDGKMDIAVPLDNWLVVCTKRDLQTCKGLLQSLSRVTQPLGIDMREPMVIQIDNDRIQAYLEAIKSNVSQNTRIVMVMLSNNRKDRYDAVKAMLCCEIPVASQCVVARTVSNPKKVMSIATKIAIQMNCKIGGAAWSVEIPLKGLMICGIDSYHDSSQKGRSVGAFVASFNNKCTRYYTKVCFQSNHQEMIDGLRTCASAAMKNYYQMNQEFPQRVIVFRDGVGDGQLGQVFEKEVPDLIRAFTDVNPADDLKLGFVVVTKRVTTRFFQENNGNGNGNGGGRRPKAAIDNPPSGTVIDTHITKPERYDYFIVSQSVNQGSVSPTSYNVIYDSTGLKPEHMQRLSYKLTHLYYNWPGTIRVPAPCQYAHKLAFLTGQSLHTYPNEALADRLFFI